MLTAVVPNDTQYYGHIKNIQNEDRMGGLHCQYCKGKLILLRKKSAKRYDCGESTVFLMVSMLRAIGYSGPLPEVDKTDQQSQGALHWLWSGWTVLRENQAYIVAMFFRCSYLGAWLLTSALLRLKLIVTWINTNTIERLKIKIC